MIIEKIAYFEGTAPDGLLWVDEEQDWPFMRLEISPTDYVSSSKAKEYLSGVFGRIVKAGQIYQDSSCRCHLADRSSPTQPRFYFSIESLEAGVFLLEVEIPKKILAREYLWSIKGLIQGDFPEAVYEYKPLI